MGRTHHFGTDAKAWWGGPPGPRPTPPSACWPCKMPISLSRQRYRASAHLRSEPREDFGGVPFGLDLAVDLLDLAVGADDEGGALDAHHLFAVHIFLFIDAVGFGRGLVLVRQKSERQIELLLEFRLRRGLIRRDADHR